MTSKYLLLFVYCLSLITLKEHAYANKKSAEILVPSTDPFTTNKSSDNSCVIFNLYKNLFEEMNSQNHPMIQVYYNRLVQKLYDTLPASVLFQKLWQIYKKCDHSTFVAMVRAQLSLFWQHNMNEYPDYDYLLMVANGFYKIKSYYLYDSLNERTQLLFERALKSLPSSLHYLFGQQEFCLMNRLHEEIFYQTEEKEFDTNPDIHFAFTWHLTKRYYDDHNKITAIFEDYTIINEAEGELEGGALEVKPISADLGIIPVTLNVALLNKHFNSFYSRWPIYDHKIGGNKTELSDDSIWQQDLNIWSVKLVDDDHLVFKQNDYLMCATVFYDNKKRLIFGLRNRTLIDGDCQWSAGKCDRR